MSKETPERREELEKGDPSKIEISITDHNLRHPEDVSLEQQKEIYREMREQGISSVRFDWDWDKTFPEPGKVDHEVMGRYVGAMEAMKEIGLKPPTLVMSTPPEWALNLYKKNPEDFFEAYKTYANSAAETLKRAGLSIEQAQVFNEINHPFLFKFVNVEDIPNIADILRNAFQDQGMEVALSTSIIVGNEAEAIAKANKVVPALGRTYDIKEFLEKLKGMKDSFDIISVDYYPGLYHFPLKKVREAGDAFPIPESRNPVKEFGNRINRTFKNTEMLKGACEEIASWDKPYEIGEAGFSTNEPYSHGRRQRMFYDMYFRALRQMVVDFAERGVALPKRVGLYETQDEENKFGGGAEESSIMRLVKKAKIYPEAHFGLIDEKGGKKEILQKGTPSPEGEERPQLKALIDYLKRPL